ncbi:MAG: SIMPL domain-containing protein [Halobacteriaceae archaeon]
MRPSSPALVAIVLVTLVAGAGVTVALTDAGGSPAAAAQSDGGRTVSVTATGTATAQPNEVVVRLTAVGTGPDAATARDRLARNASSLRAALIDAGVSEDRIRTVRYDVGPEREKRPRTDDSVAHYRAVHTFAVTVTDRDAVGAVIDAAVANGADGVDDVRFRLSEERRRSLRKQALADAMGIARGQAATLAEAGNLTIVGVHAVRTTSTDSIVDRGGAAAGDTATNVDVGPVSVSARVHVTYNATRA